MPAGPACGSHKLRGGSTSASLVLFRVHSPRKLRRLRAFPPIHESLADMLRRLASIGQPADNASMAPSPGDEDSRPQEPRGAGGLAGVFKGLASGKLTRFPSPSQQVPAAAVVSPSLSGRTTATPHSSALRGLPPEQLELFARLKDAPLNERVAAANALRYAIADYPLSPVSKNGLGIRCGKCAYFSHFP